MKLLITTSTLPVSDSDETPAFVREQAISLAKLYPQLEIVVHAPHNHYSRTSERITGNDYYEEVRFHYFWPFRFELLTGRGILPALSANPLLYAQIPFLFLFQIFSLWRLARRTRPDLLYAHWFTPQAISTALVSKVTGVPFVFTTHASDVAVLAGKPLGRKLVRWVCRKARAYTAVSERTADKLKRFFGPAEWEAEFSEKLAIIPMGVNLDTLSREAVDANRVRQQHGLDERPIVLYLGRLARKKGVEYLLDAVSRLPPELRDGVQVVIAGDGQIRGELEARAAALGLRNVVFTGYVSGIDKTGLLALADFLCLPSVIDRRGDSEGFPVVLMEGLAAGKIVLASDVSGAETLLQDGETGFLFPQQSASELSAALARALATTDEDAARYRRNSRRLSTRFDWSVVAAEHYRLLAGAAGAGHAGR